MAIRTISEFFKTNEYSASSLKYGVIRYLKESMGPEDYERFCHFAYINNEFIQTAPHIDIFDVEGDNRTSLTKENIKDNGIIVSGITIDIEADFYDNDDYTLSQYFLEHPTREGIQYLIQYNFGSEDHDDDYTFKAFVPGLIIADNNEVLGYIHSYKAGYNNRVTLEVPYDDSSNYTLTGDGFTFNRSGNSLIIKLNNAVKTNVTLQHGNTSKTFTIFPDGYSTSTQKYRVKIANEHGDYTIAAQLTEHNSINEVLDLLSAIKRKDTNYHYLLPKVFTSMALESFCEAVRNVSLGIYKVPVALVLKGENRFFMIDVAGISANKIIENRN